MEVYKAITQVTAALAKTGIAKSKQNQQQGFKYRGIDDVYNELATLLATNNLCILPRMITKEVTERTNAKGTALFYTSITAEFDLVSSVDGSKHTVSSYGEAMDSGDKSVGKAMSYAYKSMAFMTFAIPTEGDNDPDAQCHEVKVQVISDEQVNNLKALISEVNANEEGLCAYYKVATVAELPVSKYGHACATLEKKRAK